MKRRMWGSLALVAVVLVVVLASLPSGQSSKQGMTGNGFPQGDSATGCVCHNIEGNPGVTFTLEGMPTAYEPGASYALWLNVTDTPVQQVTEPQYYGGFSLVVSKGSLAPGPGFQNYIQVSNDKKWASHTEAGANATAWPQSWSLIWTAPPEPGQEVKIEWLVNSVNGNGNFDSGDQWFAGLSTLARGYPAIKEIKIPVLSMLILITFFGGVVALVLGRKSPNLPRYLALAITLVALVLSLYTFALVYNNAHLPESSDQAGEEPFHGIYYEYIDEEGRGYGLLPDYGVTILLGVDGLSAPMVLLTGIIGPLVILFAWDEKKRPGHFYGLLLILQAALFGVFVTLDYFVFYIFWEAVLIPMFFLIGIWGGLNRRYASIKFFIYTFTASMVMLVAIMALYFAAGGDTFSMIEIAKRTDGFSHDFQLWVFAALFFGFAVKIPVVPWHTWLPDAHVEAPTAGSAWLAGVLLKMGAYGLIRAALPMAPQGAEAFVPVMVGLAIASILYGALLSLGQKDLKKLVAYASISHMGIALLGIATLTPLGIAGAIFMMFAHGIISPAMFMVAGTLQHRAKTRRIPDLGGLARRMPWVGSLWLVIFLGSLGLPGLAAFVAEFTVFVAFWDSHGWWLVLPIIGVIFSAAYHLWAVQRAMFGPLKEELKEREIADGSWNENLPMAVLMLLAVLFGILPAIIMEMVGITAGDILALMGVN